MKTDKNSLIGNNLFNNYKKNDVISFRAKQLFNWLYRNKVNNFNDLNNLPTEFINFLRSEYCIHPLDFCSSD